MFCIDKAKVDPLLSLNNKSKPKACALLMDTHVLLLSCAPYIPGHCCPTVKEWLHLHATLLGVCTDPFVS